MSNDEDDIEDQLNELTKRIKELEELIQELYIPSEKQEEDVENLIGETDLWQKGKISEQAHSMDEYQKMRRKASRSTDFTVPYFGPELQENKMENYVDLFVNGFESLDSLYTSLSESDWKKVVKEIFIASRIVGKGPFRFEFSLQDGTEVAEVSEEEMMFAVKRSRVRPLSFGITVNSKGSVKFMQEASPMMFVEAYDSYWFSTTPPSSTEDIAQPWEVLELSTPEQIRNSIESDDSIQSMVGRGIIKGNSMSLEELIKTDILPKVLRVQKRGNEIPRVFNKLGRLVQRERGDN